jgi:hypothetical protein
MEKAQEMKKFAEELSHRFNEQKKAEQDIAKKLTVGAIFLFRLGTPCL